MYADHITPSMRSAMDETARRREIQDQFNKDHGIVPRTIRKDIHEMLQLSKAVDEAEQRRSRPMLPEEREEAVARLEQQMKEAAQRLEFELAAALRDQIIELRGRK